MVPSLLLQPPVENALKHGLSGRGGQGLISISGELAAERLTLTIRDTRQGPQGASEEKGSGLALAPPASFCSGSMATSEV